MITCNDVLSLTTVIPMSFSVIPAKAGIHHQRTHRQAYYCRIVSIDSRLRGNDEAGQPPSVEEIEQELGGEQTDYGAVGEGALVMAGKNTVFAKQAVAQFRQQLVAQKSQQPVDHFFATIHLCLPQTFPQTFSHSHSLIRHSREGGNPQGIHK